MTKIRITCLCLAVLLLMPMLFTGCGKDVSSPLAAYTENSMARVGDGVYVQNDGFMLAWWDSLQRFTLIDKVTGHYYYSSPVDSYYEEINAPVIVEYYQEGTANETTSEAAGVSACLDNDTYSVEMIENGFRAVYSFEEERLAVTVEYLLRDNGMEIRIPMDGLQEDETNRIYEIKVAPFFAAAYNDTGSYLMVPSGSGALIQAQHSASDDDFSKKEYYESVYGDDLSEPLTFRKRMQSQIYLPVFGSMNIPTTDGSLPNTGMLGIIEKGAECAMIYAKTGGIKYEYSTVYPAFRIRSRERVVYNTQGGTKQSGLRYSNDVISEDYLSVCYIPLSEQKGEDITYNGMAATYRKYLQDKGYLTDAVANTPSLSINMIGSTQMTESFFGIPYQSDVAVTTLSRTQDIVSELKALLGDKSMLVTLEGYGKGGLANAQVGGGFSLSSTVGSKKDLAALISYAADNGIILSMDYELAQFQNSGSGISVGSDSVMGVSSLKSEVYTYNINTGLRNKDGAGLSWYLVARSELTPLMNKVMKAVDKYDVSAISLGSLNRVTYSDYRTDGYAARSGFAADVVSMLQQAIDKGTLVVADEANDYVAVNSDYITEVPLHSTKFNLFTEDVPFYSMVFQGYVPLSSASINLALDPTDAYLQAVSTGMALQFTLCDTLHEATLWDEDTAFVSSRYVDWKDRIAEMVNESAPLYEKVGNQAIVRYENHGEVSITEFANGTIVYVNYGDEAVNYEGVQLEANSFVYR